MSVRAVNQLRFMAVGQEDPLAEPLPAEGEVYPLAFQKTLA